jgi:hypothetical protein
MRIFISPRLQAHPCHHSDNFHPSHSDGLFTSPRLHLLASPTPPTAVEPQPLAPTTQTMPPTTTHPPLRVVDTSSTPSLGVHFATPPTTPQAPPYDNSTGPTGRRHHHREITSFQMPAPNNACNERAALWIESCQHGFGCLFQGHGTDMAISTEYFTIITHRPIINNFVPLISTCRTTDQKTTLPSWCPGRRCVV